jgi:hypothetical protein
MEMIEYGTLLLPNGKKKADFQGTIKAGKP